MKLLSSAMLALLFISGQSVAEQTPQPGDTRVRDAIVVPATQQQSPFDLNHMGVGSDKSDELGVPYYNRHFL